MSDARTAARDGTREASKDGKARAQRGARADRAQEIGRRLIDAAARIVGAEGYANASVAKITAQADVAQGTFYNYFASQQDLFDHLLPELGGQMLEFIRERVKGIDDSFAREEAGFRAFFEFLQQRPEFYRILNEAETFSPKAFRAHMRNMADGYLRALRRSRGKGELPGFEERELEVIVYTLLAARNYIAYRYVSGDRVRSLPAWVTEAYIKLATGGMRYGGTARRTGRRHAKTAAPAPTASGPDVRVTARDEGYAEITLSVHGEDLDAAGLVATPVLMQALETVTRLAATGSDAAPAPRLETISFGFVAPTSTRQLRATARVEGGARARLVSARISDASGTGAAIATAQAVYHVEVS
jgi:AcrR family transcriptional regulator